MKRKLKEDSYRAFMKQPSNAAIVHEFVAKLQRDKKRDETVIGAIERNGEVPTAAHMEQLRRYAQARMRYMKEVPLLRSSDIAEFSGSTARNGSARASRWKKERRIFSVPWNGIDYYPAFQFSSTDGEPLPTIQKVLEIFGDKLSEWQTAFWFWGGNGWLHDASPMEVIESNPDLVVEAARHEMEPVSG
jgi:hypothetical protein